MYEEKFLSKLPFLNFILATLIVFHHCFNINIEYNSYLISSFFTENSAYIIERYLYNISECSVPVFFFVSSFLFFRTYDQNIEVYKYKIHKRLYSLFIPYILYNTLGYFKHIIISGESFDVLNCLTSIINSSSMPLWFIRELMIFAILAPVFYFMITRKKIAFIVIIMATILSVFGIFTYRSFLYWIPIYVFGGMMNDKFIQKKISSWICNHRTMFLHITILLFFLVLIVAFFLPNSFDDKISIPNSLIYYSFRLICIPPIILLTFVFPDVRNIYFFKYSFFMYCIHFPVISIIKLLFGKFPFFGVLLEYFLTALITILIVCIIGFIIENKFPKLWGILNGRR